MNIKCKKCNHDRICHIDIREEIFEHKEAKPKKCWILNCKCKKYQS